MTPLDWMALVFSGGLGVATCANLRSTLRRGEFPSPPARLASLSIWAAIALGALGSVEFQHLFWVAPASYLAGLLLGFSALSRLTDPVTRLYAVLLAIDIPPPSEHRVPEREQRQ